MVFQRMNKRGFEFKAGLFAIIAVSIMVIAYGVIISEQEDKYNSGVTSQIDQYDRLDNISTIAGNQRGSLTPDDPDPGSDPEANTFRGVYSILSSMPTAFDIVVGKDGMIAELTNQFGIPDYVRQGIVTFMVIAIALALVAIIFRLSIRGTV